MSRRHREWLIVAGPGLPESQVELVDFPVRIGRGPANEVVLSDDTVSATHAQIAAANGQRLLHDLGSTNGTTLNGRSVDPATPALIRDRDVVGLGDSTLIYRVEGSAAPLAPPADGQEPPLRRPAWGWRLLRLLLVLLFIGLLLVAGAWLLSPPRLALLILGSDARPDEIRRGEPGRTDTLMTLVAQRPPATSALVSLPRDLWVPIPGSGEERINVAYALGGSAAAKRAVGDLLGTRIDRYLLVGLQGVRDLVDAAGGIEIDVETPIHDPAYPTDDYGTIVVDIPAGRQQMNGETALRYARTRHQDSDFGRIERQQRVLAALREKLLQPLNWWRLPAVLAAAQASTRTDLGPLDLLPVGISLLAGPSGPSRLVVGPGLVEPFSGANGAYLLRPTPAIQRSVAVLLSPEAARLEILNATTTAGRARQAADTLRGRGFQSVRFGDAPPGRASSIDARPGAEQAARQAASAIGLAPSLVRTVDGLPDDLDVRITLADR